MISREFAVMNASYEFGDFPARPSQRECLSCTFAEVCPELLKWDAWVTIGGNRLGSAGK